MPASIVVNGIDLSTLGVYVTHAAGYDDAPDRSFQALPLLGRMGSLLSAPATHPPRTLTLTGTVDPSARTVTALYAGLHVIRDLLSSGPLTLTFTDTSGNVRRIEGLLTRFAGSPRMGKQHFQASQVSDFTATITCPDPTYRDVEPTLLAIAASTRVSLPLGTAPSSWRGRFIGASPSLTYRTAGGAPLWTLTLSQAITANEDWFDFDATTGRIWFYDNGTRFNAIVQLVAGHQDWPKALDPQDGDYATSQWPTLDSNVAGEILYYRRWL